MIKNKPGKCEVSWCDRPLLWKGFCHTHYVRQQRGWNMDKPFKVNHGMVKTPEWNAWVNMLQRTGNPKHRDYHYYGGRGITVEDGRWKQFENFFDDMGMRPQGLSLERIDNDKGYCKDNCKWATKSEQMRNRRPFTRKRKYANITAS